MMPQRLQREEYLKKLIAFQDKNIIKIITGIRRCGKSTLMEIFQDHLRSTGVENSQILHINFEDFDYRPLRDPAALHSYITERMARDRMTEKI